MEIKSYVVNFTWSHPKVTGCPITVYIIYYRETQLRGKDTVWLQIHITQLNKTSYDIPLKCDTNYEIAIAAKDEERESVMSNFWRVKTELFTRGLFFHFSCYFD